MNDEELRKQEIRAEIDLMIEFTDELKSSTLEQVKTTLTFLRFIKAQDKQ